MLRQSIMFPLLFAILALLVLVSGFILNPNLQFYQNGVATVDRPGLDIAEDANSGLNITRAATADYETYTFALREDCTTGQVIKSGATSTEWDCGNDLTGAGGSAITLDLADDASDESVDLIEIATTGDTNSVFTEPTADKLLIAVGTNWPTSDAADALSANPADCAADTKADAIAANGDLTCTAVDTGDITDSTILEADLAAVDAAADEECLTYEATVGDFEWQTCGGGGSAIILDLADDSSNESTDIAEIATTGDTNSIFTEPSADKLLIDVGNNWPTADTANAGDSATAFFSSGEIADAQLSDTLTVGNAGTVDPDAVSCDVGDDNLISEDCIGDVLDASEIEDIYLRNDGDDTTTGNITINNAATGSLTITSGADADLILDAVVGADFTVGNIAANILQVETNDASETMFRVRNVGAGESDVEIFNGDLLLMDNGGIVFEENSANGANFIKIDAGDSYASDYTVTLEFLADCTGNTNGGALTINASNEIVCSDDDGGAGGGGDNITVNTTAADTTGNFLDGDIDWTLVDGGAGGPDDITATVACSGCVDVTDIGANAVDGSELVDDSVDTTELDDTDTPLVGQLVATDNATATRLEYLAIGGGLTSNGDTLIADLGTTIDSTELEDEAVTEAKLDALDTAADEECLTFESTGTRLEWQTCGGGGSSAFNDITSGTNTTADMVVGSGATLTLAVGGITEANQLLDAANNDSGATLFECTAVYDSGFDIPSDLHEIDIADADNSAQMPVIGLVHSDITNGSDGFVVISGTLDGLDTATAEGWSVGDELYVNDSGTSADSDCGNTLTNTRPANTDDAVQKVGIVGRVHATNGQILVIGAGRSNDVPNLADDNVWVGSSTNVATATAVSDCDDAGGQIFTYDTALNSFACGDIQDNALTFTSTVIVDGASASLEVPNAAGGRTVNAAGELTVDTTSDTLNFYDGAGERVLNPVMCPHTFAVESPGASEDLPGWFTPFAVTVTEMRAVLVGSATPSVTWTIRHGTDRSAAGAEVVTGGTVTTSVTTGSDVTAFNDATIVSDSHVWMETTAQSGTVNSISVTMCYRQDA